MAHQGPVRRWEIYWVDLEPAVGREQAGDRRPAVVVSNDGFNHIFDIVTVVPMTKRKGKKRRVYPFEVLAPDLLGTGQESILMPQQVRTISKLRLLERGGVLEDPAIQIDLENRLLEHLGIDFEADGL
ncbi:MAG: type II toxin-antitoxin system PemK/MazF family toxin [Gemmatimonadota bacterium]